MRTLEPKITNWETVEWRHSSKWRSPQTVRTHDMSDFGPDAAPDPWGAQPASLGRKKPVLYVPIPRRRKEELYPKVSLTICLEVVGHATSLLPAFDVYPVETEVLNRWNPKVSPEPSVPLQKVAQLKDGACTMDFSADDLRLAAPIVYHLSATSLTSEVTFRLKTNGSHQDFKGMDGVRKFVKLCLEIGFMPNRKVVPDVKALSDDQRRRLALGADAWSHFWEERFERSHRILGGTQDREDTWASEQLVARGLVEQNRLRLLEMGWSEKLEQDATRFHRFCEKGTAESTSGWEERAYLFYSVNEDTPTTLKVEAELEFKKPYRSLSELLTALKEHTRSTDHSHSLLRTPCERRKGTPREFFEQGTWRVPNVKRQGSEYLLEVWRPASLQQCLGDGTVPLWSQLGFGAQVKVFRKLFRTGADPDDDKYVCGPKHMDAPNNSWAWARIVDVLRGQDVSNHFAAGVNTTIGEDKDKRLEIGSIMWNHVLEKNS